MTSHNHAMPGRPNTLSRRTLLRTLLAAALTAPVRVRTGHAATRAPTTCVLDGAGLLRTQAELNAGGTPLAAALRVLQRDADDALAQPLLTVTTKAQLPPSGDRHDYLSQAPYFWPNTKTPDGLPYVRRDGQINPEADAIPDANALDQMETRAGILALAHFYTREARYGAGAAALLRAWFVDPATAMNPNLTFAQLIPGVSEARPNGIIEGHLLCRVPDWCALLAESTHWTAADALGMREWFAAYADWLARSDNGRAAARLKNNQGTWYFAQLAVANHASGAAAPARQAVRAGQKLLQAQVNPRGLQPLELARTRPLAYSTFNLRGHFTLAAAGQALGEPSWCKSELRRALDYVLPRALKQGADAAADASGDLRPRDLAELALQASHVFGDAGYARLSRELDPEQAGARYALTSARLAAPCG